MAISLTKGQQISLEKDGGDQLRHMCVGINWGAIEKKSFFGTKKIAVDLDASVGMFSESGNSVGVVYYGDLRSKCGGLTHSGDDLTGDMDGDDGLDNEVIVVNLDRLNPTVDQLAFVLNSFQGHDFKDISFARIRIYEGTPDHVEKIYATFDIANDARFAGSVSMIMGKLSRHNNTWKFTAIGESTRDKKLTETLNTFVQHYM
ncbi:MAG: TerD family protein [Candidatus Electrothrix sp. AS4_5]|nr:TerD family protein [Candidatus Electrothrix gigas]MCI5189604.1 TerD family protein [Candidatus Electrothrix gigas]MCI5225924.1 TerD family protein [Candidatus Electrothrix gigas]